MLTKEEQKQYDRHLILDQIGEKGQLKLKAAKVLVIGAGGLGCPILQYLSAAGVGTIGVVDSDAVDQSNLQRQVLFTHDDLGKSKAETAVKRLSKLNPFINFKVHNNWLDKTNALRIIEGYDIVIDGSDNFPTRYLVNDACVILKKPLVFGSIFKFEGQISVFNYKKGPSYRCLFPSPPGEGDVPNCSEIGVLGVLPGLIGVLQANEVVKIICEIGDVLSGKLLLINMLNMQFVTLDVTKTDEANRTEFATDYKAFCGVLSSLEMTYDELEDKLDAYHLLDVRTYEEREDFNIGGDHIPLDELSKRISEITSKKPIVVYCKSGIRSKKAIALLKEELQGTELINLKGGVGLLL